MTWISPHHLQIPSKYILFAGLLDENNTGSPQLTITIKPKFLLLNETFVK